MGSAMTLDQAIAYLHNHVNSSHNPGWQEKRAAWDVLMAHLADKAGARVDGKDAVRAMASFIQMAQVVKNGDIGSALFYLPAEYVGKIVYVYDHAYSYPKEPAPHPPVVKKSLTAEESDYPECSGDPMSCPENEGYGCCKSNVAQPDAERDADAKIRALRNRLITERMNSYVTDGDRTYEHTRALAEADINEFEQAFDTAMAAGRGDPNV